MIFEDGALLETAIDITFILLMLAIVVAFIRLVLGPSLPDRVVALDLITVLAVAFSALFAIAAEEPAFLDVAIALALIAFLATVAFARFAERRRLRAIASSKEAEEGS
ncbi:cation:proton antiporter [Denitrobaculum tricleocarpae]|uniref:pH regulation protein F n=1 Tax=Denitrobaculum tricleocarpae TaxID=2591009 RepID=A0A545TMN0_9PROT|nr:cation:proton antiporter [Denitrobaculum tricleocarpae]TQV78493.1 pH regulation protein F [Denitrobaculum tricleocarpae]